MKETGIKGIAKELGNKTYVLGNNELNYIQIMIFISGVISIIASFLPMYTADVFTVSVSQSFIGTGDGKVSLVLMIVMLWLTYMKNEKVVLGCSMVNAGFVVYDCFIASNGGGTGLTQLSIGGYLVFITAVISVVMGVLYYLNGTQSTELHLQDSFQHMVDQATIKCPDCGMKVIKGKRFCPSCGHQMIEDHRDEHICQQCGAIIDKKDQFCPKCGTKTQQNNICPHCGNTVEKGTKFCPKCGTGIKE